MLGEKRAGNNRRIALTVPGDLDEVLGRIAVAYGKPKATVIVDILSDALPSLRKIAAVSEKLASVQQGVAGLWRGAAHGNK
jgi:hypothetical protein